MTLSLVAVFIPMLFMSGLLGRLFHEFAVTIAVSILVSGFVSLTLTPMLGSRFLRPRPRPSKQALSGFRAGLRSLPGVLRLDVEKGVEISPHDNDPVWSAADRDGGSVCGGAQRVYS